MSLPLVYSGSVKDVLGPLFTSDSVGARPGYLFRYSDAFSVFDWGRMPDLLDRKGTALAILAAHFFEKLQRGEAWDAVFESESGREFLADAPVKTQAKFLREILCEEGLRTHYRGLHDGSESGQVMPLEDLAATLNRLDQPVMLAVDAVDVFRPTFKVGTSGATVTEYPDLTQKPALHLLPIEFVFRFSLPKGSSLAKRVEESPSHLTDYGFPGSLQDLTRGVAFPFVECFTKLESQDRPLSRREAIQISGLTEDQFEKVLTMTACAAHFLHESFAKVGLSLADGKFEWAYGAEEGPVLVDAIGPDELRVLHGSVQLSKEWLRQWYRTSPEGSRWVALVEFAKERDPIRWKEILKEEQGAKANPPHLPPELKHAAAMLYQTLTNTLTNYRWFEGAPALPDLLRLLGGKR